MASLFRARRRRSPEDDGEDDRSGGGRAQRRRLSPEEDAASPEEAEAAAAAGSSPGWLSGFVSGAKRVISSVLLFSSPEETGSGEEDDDEVDGLGSECFSQSDENEDVPDTYGALVPYSESKLAIEQMVMKETFTRDECDKMIELIKSRVTDYTFPEARENGSPEEMPSRNAGIGHDFTGAWRSLIRDRNFSKPVPSSSMRPGSFSPGSPLQASPELCTAAVTEAKKWLEEKRRRLGLKTEDNGTCTLNTDILSSGIDTDMGSPVDVAKSYMQSLPPWQSPFLGSQKFSTSPSKYSSLLSTVTTKEDYLSNFWEKLEESRRARIGSPGGSADAPKFWRYGSTSRLFENDTSIFSLGTDDKVGEPTETNNGSEKVAATEPVSGSSIPIVPTEDRNDGIDEPVDLAKVNRNAPEKYHAASEIQPGNISFSDGFFLCLSTKAATDHSGDAKAPTAEPNIGGSHVNSASELRPKDAGPPIQTRMNGSTKKTSVNGPLDQSKANSGLESSGNDNPSCTNSSSAVRPTSNDLTNSAAGATDVDSIENGTGPEERALRRGRKRVVRGARGRGK
ncbi:hypothetical protein HU200_057845 [Digitaria exilis]|uniref:Protein KAKU4 n=1 Tax=Digitaria exilis TaxID=1010633 RepID=A0A835E131_9POAL|nr:hypothetical protein HU200_057845 [Digitaria exilis]